MMITEPVKVLYIGGYGRSGSTLLARMLAQLDGFISVGELCYIWERGFAENQLCGCGSSFRECEFWQAVIDRAFGGFERVPVEEMIALRRALQTNRAIPALIFPSLRSARFRESHAAYLEVSRKLYRAIQAVSGNQVVIDSSKLPRYASLLKEIPDLDLRILHLIRDSRATAYSWTRKKVRPEIHWMVKYMDRQSLFWSALEWMMTNGFLESLKRDRIRNLTVRYEDLVAQPQPILSQITALTGEHTPDKPLGSGDTLVLDVDHTLSGNPNRFQRGAIRIRPDTEWQEKMSLGQKTLVTTFTWPLLLWYGYLGR